MKRLTERRQCADDRKRAPLPKLGTTQHFQSEIVVVVLGVMYPTVLPQRVEADIHLDLVPLPPGLAKCQQGQDVVFHDPLSFSTNADAVPKAAKYLANRTEAQKAVAHDLALLSLRKGG